MAVPGRLVLLVLLHICTHGTSGTPATSCDSCHNQAFCLEHKERGDTFLRHTHPYICLCKDGFVGDGLTCYDTKLCSDSSCCSSGFFWSPEKGCVDVDECTLPDSPCNSRQNCKNLPGSFECLDSLSEQGSEPLSRSFQAVCGGTFCPTGMDCIFFNGTSRCADPCHVYTVLNDSWRSTNSGIGGHCDRDISWQGWYRMFLEQASARIPVGSMELYKCETRVPMWLGEPHPTQIGVIVNRTACNSWGGCSTGHQIHVKRCYGGYYVYKLVAPSTCTYAYCSEVDEIEYSTMPPVVNRTQGPENTSPTFRPTFPPVNSTHMPTLPATSWRTTRPHHNITLPPHNTTGVEGEVRLANGGNSSCSGRVEIFHFGQWGTVCDDRWDLLDAEVVCRQLGCGRVLSAPTQARFGQGSGPIWYDNVVCTGSEAKLSECRHQGIGSHNCGHHEDAGVVCEATSPVRLANSGNRCSGRVEIFHDGQWGTVCDDHWDIDNANVVCRQLDCGTAQSALSNAAFGAGRGPIWLDDVSCSGSESSISDCRHSGFGVHNCGHSEDASIICGSPSPPKDAFHLHCSERKILVQVQASRLLAFGFDPFSGHLADRNCTWISESFGTIVYEVDTQPEACGNVMKTNRTHVTYINNIFLYEQNSSFSIPKRLPISCTYPLEADATLDVAVWPILVENGGISGVGSPARANMSLYRSAAFNDTYPPGSVAISVGSPLYVGVSVEDRGPNFVATLEDCFASPSRYSHTNVKYPLIQNKCPVDPRQVVVIENGRSTRARFSALFFPPNGKHTAVYLHCNLTLCDVTKYSCFTSCRRRASRSAFSSPSATPISVGPITWAD